MCDNHYNMFVAGKQCLQEMSLMLVCLQNNDYLENSCSKEIKAFNSCLQEFEVSLFTNALSKAVCFRL